MIANAAARSHAADIVRAVTARRGMHALAPHIRRSWTRCVEEYGIHPDVHREAQVLPRGRLHERQEELGALFGIARSEMENLYGLIAGTGYAVMLSDTTGTILGAVLDPDLGPAFRRAGLTPGAHWDERSEGTNGIGTCLVERGAVTVHHGEHFHDRNIRMSCSGAPIVDAHGGVLAVLGAASVNRADTREIQRHTVALVSMSAGLVSRCVFLDAFADAWILRFHSRPEFVGLLQEAMVAVDEDGKVLAVDEHARMQLGIDARGSVVGHPVGELFEFDAEPMHHRSAHAATTIWPIRDAERGRRFHALLRPPQPSRRKRAAAAAPDASAIRSPCLGPVLDDRRIQQHLAAGRQLLARRVPILLLGATGTGKDVFARALHACSPWSDGPFITINCAATPEHPIEGALFGRQAGAIGMRDADGNPGADGTLFLDEVGDLPLAQQAHLLRAIGTHGLTLAADSDARQPTTWHVIGASHRDLRRMMGAGEFRADLYYRLAGATLDLPALKDRTDREELIRALLREEPSAGAKPMGVSANALRCLLRYDWPGNIRQLRNALRTASALSGGSTIRVSNLPQEIIESDARRIPAATVATRPPAEPSATESALRDAECEALVRVLARYDWNISHASQALAVSRNTLYRKLRKHGIAMPARR